MILPALLYLGIFFVVPFFSLARTSLSAYDAVQNVYSGLGVLNAALSAIPSAAGQSPQGVLASVGYSSMHNKDVSTAQDQCRIGLAFTKVRPGVQRQIAQLCGERIPLG